MVKRTCLIVLFCGLCWPLHAADFHEHIAAWLRSHKFDQVASDDRMAAGKSGEAFVYGGDDMVVVREPTYRPDSWRAKLFDSLQVLASGREIRIVNRRNAGRSVSVIWIGDDELMEDFAAKEQPQSLADDERYFQAVKTQIEVRVESLGQ